MLSLTHPAEASFSPPPEFHPHEMFSYPSNQIYLYGSPRATSPHPRVRVVDVYRTNVLAPVRNSFANGQRRKGNRVPRFRRNLTRSGKERVSFISDGWKTPHGTGKSLDQIYRFSRLACLLSLHCIEIISYASVKAQATHVGGSITYNG